MRPRQWAEGVVATIRHKPSILVAPVVLTVLLVVGSVLAVLYGAQAVENGSKASALVRESRPHLPASTPAHLPRCRTYPHLCGLVVQMIGTSTTAAFAAGLEVGGGGGHLDLSRLPKP